jgi:hypothetical protein
MQLSSIIQAGLQAAMRRASSLSKEHEEFLQNYLLYEDEVAVLITGSPSLFLSLSSETFHKSKPML